jgi:Asp-tRNA(Asn)/Glu-tRNA(Gln) amidotransferase A subunit family amidase
MDLVFSGTIELAAEIRAGQVSATEVLEAHLAQIEQRNPALNAIVIMDVGGARARAREADEALARGEAWGPLHGVPFTLKDVHSTAGMRTTVGFPQLADYVAQEDSTVAARLREAGAVLIGKTNVAMMLADYQSSNLRSHQQSVERRAHVRRVQWRRGGRVGRRHDALRDRDRSLQLDSHSGAFLWCIRTEADRKSGPADWTLP